MIADPADPDNVSRRIQIQKFTMGMLDRAGITDSRARELAIQTNLTAAHKGVITALLASPGGAVAAGEYFNIVTGEILQSERAAIINSITEGSVLQQGQKLSDQILAVGGTPEEQVARAKALSGVTPETRKETVRLLDVQHARDARARKIAKGEAAADVWKWLADGKPLNQYPASNGQESAKRWELVVSDGTLLASMQNKEKKNALGELFASQTDGKTAAAFGKLTRREQVDFNLESIRHKLTEGEWKSLVRKQESAKAALDSKAEKASTYNTGYTALIKAAPTKALREWRTSKAKSKARETMQEAESDLDTFILDFFDRTGNMPDVPTVKEEAARIMMQFTADAPGRAFSGLVASASGVAADISELSEADRAVVTIPEGNITRAFRAELVKTIQEVSTQYPELRLKADKYLLENLAGAIRAEDRPRQMRLLGLTEKRLRELGQKKTIAVEDKAVAKASDALRPRRVLEQKSTVKDIADIIAGRDVREPKKRLKKLEDQERLGRELARLPKQKKAKLAIENKAVSAAPPGLRGQTVTVEGEVDVGGNNNPGNIRATDIPWDGKTGSKNGFEVFDTPESGVRAMGKLLQTYESKHGLNTVEGIISRYAPPLENPTESYISFVKENLGIERDTEISTQDRSMLSLLVQSMIRFEGHKNFDKEIIHAGIGRLSFSGDT